MYVQFKIAQYKIFVYNETRCCSMFQNKHLYCIINYADKMAINIDIMFYKI